jgi:DNA invertase Pin-like site-specific DNA recombinase
LLLFWSLDRLTREGTFKTLCYLRQLSTAGVKYKSLTEQYIDSLGVFSEAIVGIIGAIAEQERLRISERTKAGMAWVAATGKHCGRPRAYVDVAQLHRLREKGLSYSAIAKKVKLSRAVVWERMKAPISKHSLRTPA